MSNSKLLYMQPIVSCLTKLGLFLPLPIHSKRQSFYGSPNDLAYTWYNC